MSEWTVVYQESSLDSVLSYNRPNTVYGLASALCMKPRDSRRIRSILSRPSVANTGWSQNSGHFQVYGTMDPVLNISYIFSAQLMMQTKILTHEQLEELVHVG